MKIAGEAGEAEEAGGEESSSISLHLSVTVKILLLPLPQEAPQLPLLPPPPLLPLPPYFPSSLMSEPNPKKFRTVNPTLGTSPKVGPFPADQVIPWTAIFLTSYYLCKSVFGLSWLWTGLVAAWGMSTWWVLTGSKAWRFLSKFISTPNWTRGYAQYQRIVERKRGVGSRE